MLNLLVRKVFGTRNDRELKRLQAYVEKINALEPSVKRLSDAEIMARTAAFKEVVQKGFSEIEKDAEPEEKKREESAVLDGILPEAFATVREASWRTLGMRHYDVQLIGGMVLNEGKIAEMKTGEGKTLVATLAIYLNALTGRGAHVVTVNDYLGQRDAEWMGKIYSFLGLTVGVIQNDMNDAERKAAYSADITYGTNNEFGFDFLRDNMKFSLEDFVQREHNFAVVDEVDSILIDEARTPLIISGPAEESTDKYYMVNSVIPKLRKEEDFQVEEKTKSATLTEEGVTHVESLLNVDNLYDPKNVDVLHHVQQGLRAHALFKKDTDYIVKDGQVIIVDEFTGRLMSGRRWSDGLHQAVEAKEGVKIENENQTLASITFQNYFRFYKKLSGMTGTADTEAAEFQSIYNLEVVLVPPNKPVIRKDFPDLIYRTNKEKFNAIADEIGELNKRGQPVLVGTISINNSELISKFLKKRGIKHNVLNAKFHEMEAEIVAQAGRFGGVTIATNMAGRGTDILLGGNPEFLLKRDMKSNPDPGKTGKQKDAAEHYNMQCREEKEAVLKAGGLHILGTERHESRRIDNQLRGRSGRQGDPGSSRFFLSLEDDLLRIFGSDRISGIMQKLGMEEGEPIEHSMISKAIENAQKKVEGHNFGIRKHLLEYDDVMSKQREVIYSLRRQALGGEGVRGMVLDMVDTVIGGNVPLYANPSRHSEEWDLSGLADYIRGHFGITVKHSDETLEIPGAEPVQLSEVKGDELVEILQDAVVSYYDEREREVGSQEMMRYIERMMLLQVIDAQWKDHLLSMDHLKEGIGFRGYAQKNPLNEYKREGFDLFSSMIFRIKEEVTQYLYKVQVATEEELEGRRRRDGEMSESRRPRQVIEHRGEQGQEQQGQQGQGGANTPVKRAAGRVGRNAPCSCGSGKKYKKCCGAAA